ncbi:alpha/beta hydrolase [Chloroflexota bacterium]
MDIEQYMDPELRAAFMQMPERHDNPIDWVAERRRFSQERAVRQMEKPISNQMTIKDHNITGPAGSPPVPIRIYTPSPKTATLPGFLFIHGGGFTNGPLLQDFDITCWHIVENVGCVVVSVGYRLAPENPFPAGVEDCYAALQWMASSAPYLGIDTEHIAVGGQSAGGGLAAAVTLMARDRKEFTPVFQLLLWACLDDRHTTPSSHAITDSRIWNRERSLCGWKAYLGNDYGGKVSPYAAPARMEDLSGLPPAYIIVGGLDLLRDENIEYATRLMQAGTSTELHVIPGAFHGFVRSVPTASVSIRTASEYMEALKRALTL